MTVSELVALIKGKPNWAALLKEVEFAGVASTVSGKDMHYLAKLMQEDLQRNRSTTALAAGRVGGFLNPALFMRELRRAGILRASKTAYHGSVQSHIVSALLTDGQILPWPIEFKQYLQSVQNILSIAPQTQLLRASIIKRLKKHKLTVLKSCLVLVDRGFRPAADDLPDADAVLARTHGHPDYFSPEERASSFSLLVALMKETVGFDEAMTIRIDEESLLDDTFEQLLQDGARLARFRDFEILLDGFPYQVALIDDGISITAIDKRLSQSICMGYAQTDMQSSILHHVMQADELKHLVKLKSHAREFFSSFGSQLIKRSYGKIDRYRMEIPLAPAFTEFLKHDGLYFEEVSYLRLVASDSLVDFEWLLKADIESGLKVMDVIKAQRIFSFIGAVFFEGLDQDALGRNELDMRSRVPVFKVEVLISLFTSVLGEKVADRLLPLLTLDPGNASHMDVQYQPLLRIGSYFMIPLGVLSSSHLLRAILNRLQIRLMPTKEEPIHTVLLKAFENEGFLAKLEVKRAVDGRPLEIDVLAFRDGHLFVIECKHAYHPCSPQEMRTSYQHMNTGAAQLTRAAKWLASHEVQNTLFSELKWPVQPTDSIRTCIVNANRIFSGLEVAGHPVRHARELLNVLGSGTVLSNEKRYRFWRGPQFQTTDLIDYLDGTTITRDCFDSLDEVVLNMQIEKRVLQSVTYGIDTLRADEILRKRYQLIEDQSS